MYQYLKRFLGFLFSLIIMLIVWPLFLVLAIIIKVDSKGPVFFKQIRVGKNKKHFEILKFRTMRTDTPKDMPTHMLQNPEAFITKSGKFLRKTSLDELPQLINILKGDMSIVGPRPALWNQYDLIKERERYGANDVLPGLTGWAQINGRDTLTIESKARYDGDYIKKFGIGMDIKVFIKTIIFVLKRTGVVEGKTEEETAKEEVAVTRQKEA